MTTGCHGGDNTVAEWGDNAPNTPNSAAGPAQPPASRPTSHWGHWDFPQKSVSLPITTWDAFPSWEMGAAPKFGTQRVLAQASPHFGCPCRRDEDFQINLLGENPTQYHPLIVTGLGGDSWGETRGWGHGQGCTGTPSSWGPSLLPASSLPGPKPCSIVPAMSPPQPSCGTHGHRAAPRPCRGCHCQHTRATSSPGEQTGPSRPPRCHCTPAATIPTLQGHSMPALCHPGAHHSSLDVSPPP